MCPRSAKPAAPQGRQQFRERPCCRSCPMEQHSQCGKGAAGEEPSDRRRQSTQYEEVPAGIGRPPCPPAPGARHDCEGDRPGSVSSAPDDASASERASARTTVRIRPSRGPRCSVPIAAPSSRWVRSRTLRVCRGARRERPASSAARWRSLSEPLRVPASARRRTSAQPRTWAEAGGSGCQSAR